MGNLSRRDTDAVGVAVEEHALALTLGALGGLNPLAHAGAGPESLEKASPAGVSLGTVVAAHHSLDGIAGLVGVVEGDVADIVVQHVGLNDTVEDVATHEAKVTVNGGGGTTSEIPHLWLIVGKSGVSVLKEGDGNYSSPC